MELSMQLRSPTDMQHVAKNIRIARFYVRQEYDEACIVMSGRRFSEVIVPRLQKCNIMIR
jgi:hypothetical protein